VHPSPNRRSRRPRKLRGLIKYGQDYLLPGPPASFTNKKRMARKPHEAMPSGRCTAFSRTPQGQTGSMGKEILFRSNGSCNLEGANRSPSQMADAPRLTMPQRGLQVGEARFRAGRKRIAFCRLLSAPTGGKAADDPDAAPRRARRCWRRPRFVAITPALQQSGCPRATQTPMPSQRATCEAAWSRCWRKEGIGPAFPPKRQHHRTQSLIAVYATLREPTRSPPALHRFLR